MAYSVYGAFAEKNIAFPSGFWCSRPDSDLLAWPFVHLRPERALPLLRDFPQIPWSIQESQQL